MLQCDLESSKFSFRKNSKLVIKFPDEFKRDSATNKVNPAEAFARVWENFIVIHCYVPYANWSLFKIFFILFF